MFYLLAYTTFCTLLHYLSTDLANKMREYAIIKNPVVSNSKSTSNANEPNSGASKTKDTKKKSKSSEMREVERELECPVCMDVSRPPIYQCEEGHIICSSCNIIHIETGNSQVMNKIQHP